MDQDNSTLDVAENIPKLVSSASVMRKCCIHFENNTVSDSDLKEFSESALKKCQIILAARRKFNMSYTNFNLPVSVNSYDCYHTPCYRKFTAVKREKLLEISETDIKTLCYAQADDNLSQTQDETDVVPTIPKIRSRQKKSFKVKRQVFKKKLYFL